MIVGKVLTKVVPVMTGHQEQWLELFKCMLTPRKSCISLDAPAQARYIAFHRFSLY